MDNYSAGCTAGAIADYLEAKPLPMASYVIPDWPEDDVRWKLCAVTQARWSALDYLDSELGSVILEVRAVIEERYRARLKDLINDGCMTYPFLARELGVSLKELKDMLNGIAL